MKNKKIIIGLAAFVAVLVAVFGVILIASLPETQKGDKDILVTVVYEDKSEKEMQWWYKTILDYIDRKGMIETPDCSYAEFVKRKFPKVWEDYEKLSIERGGLL